MIRPCLRSYSSFRSGGFLILGVLLFSIGCGPNSKARGTVKGKVSIGGKNLTVGTVMFYGKDNMTASASIDKEGNYVMNDAPLGEVKITVTVPKRLPGMGMPGMKDKATKSVDPTGSGKSISIGGDLPSHIVAIPEKYEKVETSGLTFTVKSGEQTKDLPLTP